MEPWHEEEALWRQAAFHEPSLHPLTDGPDFGFPRQGGQRRDRKPGELTPGSHNPEPGVSGPWKLRRPAVFLVRGMPDT